VSGLDTKKLLFLKTTSGAENSQKSFPTNTFVKSMEYFPAQFHRFGKPIMKCLCVVRKYNADVVFGLRIISERTATVFQ